MGKDINGIKCLPFSTRLLKNRMSVWLGTYDLAKAVTFPYDCAMFKLRGEYEILNFLNLRDKNLTKLSALRSSVDAKIQEIREKVRKEQPSKSDFSCRSSSDTKVEPSKGDKSLASVLTNGLMVAEELEIEGCSLERMPSFDLELIWEIIAP